MRRRAKSASAVDMAREAVRQLQAHRLALEVQNEELRRAKLALEQANERYLDLYESAPVGYLTLSDAGIILEVNRNGAALLRSERAALLGRPFSGFVSPRHADTWHLEFLALRRLGARRTFRMALRRGDGLELPSRVACEGTPGSDGKPVVRVVVTDVSEQADVERALRESQERLGAVLDEFLDGYWHWSAEGGVTVFSGRVGTMLGIAGDGQGGEMPFDPSWADRIAQADLPTVRRTAEEVLAGREDRFDVEFRWSLPGLAGKSVRARGRVLRRDARGRALRVAGTLADVTENRQLRESLRRLEAPSLSSGPFGPN